MQIKITADLAAARALVARAGKAAESPAVSDAVGAAAAAAATRRFLPPLHNSAEGAPILHVDDSDIKRMARRMRDAGHDGATRKAVLTKFFTKGIQTPPEKIDGGMMWRIRAGVVKFYPEIERHRWRWKKEK